MLQDLINAVALGSIYLLFALGMSLAWGTIGILNFAHGSIFMFSAFTAYLIVNAVKLPLVAVILIAAIAGAVMSVAVQVLAFEPILRRAKDSRAAEMQILIGGIGVAGVPLAIAQHYTKSNPFGFTNSSFKVDTFDLGGVRITSVQIIIIALALVLGVGIARWLQVSRHGLALRSIGVDPEVSSIMGVDRRRLALTTMTIAGALAGLAGALLTYNLGALTPESGETLILKAFAAIVVGGVGSMAGVVVGSYVLAIAETVVLTQTSGLWVDAVSFGLIFLVLMFRTQGLFGRREVRRT
ncbi:branched-chain amino acid ABC transporter permease [Dactylosporangium sp. NPDC005572]|uniref:branched-chain amino acid ABC transporter permease n=1 Tax=Dactylosporangium sp. NPDC005572 TaxID=3156889 RepID=UPI0033A4C92D